jgi:cytochrome c553
MTPQHTIRTPFPPATRAGKWAWRTVLCAAAALAATPVGAADLEYGRYLAAECVTCHQASGNTEGIPSIVGWPEDHFVAVLQEYQTGARDHDVMRTIARRYTVEDLAALAAYFGSLEDGRAAP